ncbi:MAG: hypothetical protein U5O39_13575 [Gammaproteobacteria bacterium]|nr:hypothetical protein [Gammaproteobacteria bacterium]
MVDMAVDSGGNVDGSRLPARPSRSAASSIIGVSNLPSHRARQTRARCTRYNLFNLVSEYLGR